MIEIQPTPDKPLPFDLSDEQPKTHADSISVAVNTADLVEQLGGSLDYDAKDFQAALNLTQGTKKPPTPVTVQKSGVAKVLAAAVKEHDFQVFADVQQARNFVTNKLMVLADCGDPKLELKALELLGKHSDIGLFTERSEITVHHTSSTTLEASIKERVKRLMNAEVTDVLPLDDLDAHLGAVGEGSFSDGEPAEQKAAEQKATEQKATSGVKNTTDTQEDVVEADVKQQKK